MTRRRELRTETIGAAYDRYAASLFRYAVVMLGDPSAAADAVHQVFTAWLGGASSTDDEEHYLRRAVRNQCFSALRRRRRDVADPVPILEPADPAAANTEQQVVIERMLLALPAEQREVVHLKIFEGMTFQEIADATDESINTVASRYRYAIEKMRVLLQQGSETWTRSRSC
jgi:RNA polymerase sigma-70 factor, ECF subfamily